MHVMCPPLTAATAQHMVCRRSLQPNIAAQVLTATEMLLYSLLALSRLCCITALDSTVEPSGSVAIWCCFRVAANASTSSLQQQQQQQQQSEQQHHNKLGVLAYAAISAVQLRWQPRVICSEGCLRSIQVVNCLSPQQSYNISKKAQDRTTAVRQATAVPDAAVICCARQHYKQNIHPLTAARCVPGTLSLRRATPAVLRCAHPCIAGSACGCAAAQQPPGWCM
jgi:hypothetical protein